VLREGLLELRGKVRVRGRETGVPGPERGGVGHARDARAEPAAGEPLEVPQRVKSLGDPRDAEARVLGQAGPDELPGGGGEVDPGGGAFGPGSGSGRRGLGHRARL
jgi:hypothetical protein